MAISERDAATIAAQLVNAHAAIIGEAARAKKTNERQALLLDLYKSYFREILQFHSSHDAPPEI